jgi:hypothetical protein
VIRVPEVLEPDGFAAARADGEAWLQRKGSRGKPPPLWSKFREHLAHGFGQRCGYSAMYTDSGQVDHYRCQNEYRSLVYEWANYRYCSGEINSRKKCLDVLDPYEVGPSWFEVTYPGLQLVLTSNVPEEMKERARFTIEKLHLRDGEAVLRARRTWLCMYGAGRLAMEGLREMAPLIAEMVLKHGITPEQIRERFGAVPRAPW